MTLQGHIPSRAEKLLFELWGKDTPDLTPEERTSVEKIIGAHLFAAEVAGAIAGRSSAWPKVAISSGVAVLAVLLAIGAGIGLYLSHAPLVIHAPAAQSAGADLQMEYYRGIFDLCESVITSRPTPAPGESAAPNPVTFCNQLVANWKQAGAYGMPSNGYRLK